MNLMEFSAPVLKESSTLFNIFLEKERKQQANAQAILMDHSCNRGELFNLVLIFIYAIIHV